MRGVPARRGSVRPLAGWSEGKAFPSFIYFPQIRVPVSGVENACYYYSTYNAEKDTSVATDNKKKIMILGGGPNRIGQGIEFDYCCCHGRKSLRALVIEFSSENSRNFIPSKNLIP